MNTVHRDKVNPSPVSPTIFLRTCRRFFSVVPRGHRLARAILHPLLRSTPAVRINSQFGFSIVIDPCDYIGWAIAMDGYFEAASTSLVVETVKCDDVVVDVGANYGWFTLLASALLGGHRSRVVSYEPQEKLNAYKAESIAVNGFTNIEARDVAVSDSTGVGSLRLTPDRPEFAVCDEKSVGAGIRTQIVSLDEEPSTVGASIIKIDAEGHELRVLHGMRKRLVDSKLRLLLIEVHPPLMAIRQDTEQALFRMLVEHGFKIEYFQNVLHKDTRRKAIDPDRSGPHPICYNIIAYK